jgi:hypothetical protein
MRYVTTRYPNSLPDSIPARVYTAQAATDAVRILLKSSASSETKYLNLNLTSDAK